MLMRPEFRLGNSGLYLILLKYWIYASSSRAQHLYRCFTILFASVLTPLISSLQARIRSGRSGFIDNAHEAFLRRRRDKLAVLGEQLATREAARA